jgi:hypothetical protein
MPCFAFAYVTNIFILMILYDLRLLLLLFFYIIIYIRKVETRLQITGQCAPW